MCHGLTLALSKTDRFETAQRFSQSGHRQLARSRANREHYGTLAFQYRNKLHANLLQYLPIGVDFAGKARSICSPIPFRISNWRGSVMMCSSDFTTYQPLRKPPGYRFGSVSSDRHAPNAHGMSALLRKRTCTRLPRNVRLVPIATECTATKSTAIRSPRRRKSSITEAMWSKVQSNCFGSGQSLCPKPG